MHYLYIGQDYFLALVDLLGVCKFALLSLAFRLAVIVVFAILPKSLIVAILGVGLPNSLG
jgi:hypothetical protein